LKTLWRAVALRQPYALALVDGRMPGLDGLAMAAEIGHTPELAECRVILLTSEDRPEGLTRQREAGIAAVARKPVLQEELLETVVRVLSRSGPEQASEDSAAARVPEGETVAGQAACVRPLRILVAEDNPFNQQVVQHLLARQGHTVQIATDGRETLAALEQNRFDLLLLDVHMPELDGFHVIETLRQRERSTGRHLPVVALTARSMKEDRARCLEAGMDDYLAKPIRRKELFATMERVLAGHPPTEPQPSSDPPSAAEVFDAATLLTACDADPELLDKMIAIFRADASGHLDQLEAALRGGHATEVRELAHKLRGLVSAFSPVAAEAAGLLEQAAVAEQLDGMTSRYVTLAAMVKELGLVLNQLSLAELRTQVERSGR
jgi:CheY-like chemotaxis protein/HPt (histidine-containing phosphotransfer) domain-containing protein